MKVFEVYLDTVQTKEVNEKDAANVAEWLMSLFPGTDTNLVLGYYSLLLVKETALSPQAAALQTLEALGPAKVQGNAQLIGKIFDRLSEHSDAWMRFAIDYLK